MIKVAVPCPLFRCFDYRLPDDFNQTMSSLEVGMRVQVPFGRQILVGIIIELNVVTDISPNKLKSAIAVLDNKAVFSLETIKLLSWAARYYCHPLGDVMQVALPVYLRTANSNKPQLNAFWQLSTLPTSQSTHDVLNALNRAPKQKQLYQLLLNAPEGLGAVSLNLLMNHWRAPLNALLKKNLLSCLYKPALLSPPSINDKPVKLHQEQLKVINDITAQLNHHQVHVVDGITGSGKTEVYLALCAAVIAQGKQVLVLVPEIGLTGQMTQRFLSRLKKPMVVLHSAMPDKQRHSAWHAASHQQAVILLGTRSCIFTPMPNLGLIIVDEEHDGSYKQQTGFRYNARDLATVRAKYSNIPVVLGSATVSLETLNNIKRQRYQVHYLKHRANQKPPPRIELINLCSQKLVEGMSPSLLNKMTLHLKQKGQVLLFLNRRGFAPLQMCHDCGWTTRCTRCDAHMTYHKHKNLLRCHHCGAQSRAVVQCKSCHSKNIVAVGLGTERVEQYLQTHFSDANIERIDKDTTRNKGSLHSKLVKAESGQTDILIGTQMLAKGHDFPNVTLVAVLDTDQSLFSTDFRASEHLAQLITQVSGRAGRAEKSGEVLIQTHHPEHPILQTLLQSGYSTFAQQALAERLGVGLPPFVPLALLRCESIKPMTAPNFLSEALALATKLQKSDANYASVQVFGPISAPMERRAGYYRHQLMLQANHRKHLNQFLNLWVPQLGKISGAARVRWSLDVDPYDTY